MSTGPTGTIETSEPTVSTGTADPMRSLIAPTPTESPPHITTIEELMASQAVVLANEATDKATLAVLLNGNQDSMRESLFKWAASGFPNVFIVQSITLDVPPVCSDGITRSVYDYFEYCFGTDMGVVISTLQSKVNGMQISYSFAGNTLRIHVTKI